MPPLAAGSQLLIEFRAGKMNRDGKLVKPDERKGLIRVIKTEDGLVHLQWFVRAEPDILEPEDDVIVFPGEAVFTQVGAASKRVMQLKFADQADRNMLFWMQETSTDGDIQLVERTNNMLQEAMSMEVDEWQPLQLAGSGFTLSSALERGHTAGAAAAGMESVGGPTVGVVPSGPGQELGPGQLDLAQILRNIGAAPPAASAAAAACGGSGGSSRDPGASLMAALLSAMQQQQGGAGGGRDAALAAALARREAAAAGPSLGEVLAPEVLAPLLRDEEVLQHLSQYLPEGQRTVRELGELAHSPQFHQQLGTFSAALQTGQLDLAQFGLRAEGYSVADFLGAIQELVEREQQQQPPQQQQQQPQH